MPLFTKNIISKKAFNRKCEKSKGDCNGRSCELDPISVRLGNVEKTFSNGQWISQWNLGNDISCNSSSMKDCNNEIDEKYNLLKLKYEILMDMLLEQLTSNQ